LSFSYWPKRHNFFGFTYGITDRYIRSLWDEANLMVYDTGNLSVFVFVGRESSGSARGFDGAPYDRTVVTLSF
jgi:hypothetical protein